MFQKNGAVKRSTSGGVAEKWLPAPCFPPRYIAIKL
jgi:hypothetical protein